MPEPLWDMITKPDEHAKLTARRADPGHPFNFYWGKDFSGRFLFVMRFAAASKTRHHRMPNLKGVELVEHAVDESTLQLVLALKEQSNSDLFYRLCQDLLESTRSCESESLALATAIARLGRWQQLLKAGRTGELSEAEQKGLIGELVFLRDVLFTVFAPSEAVSFWQGPVAGEGDKDFAIGEIAVEIKTRASSAPARVHISSEGQLHEDGFATLVLGIFELSAASADSAKAFNLSELVASVRERLLVAAPAALDVFEQRLWATGFSDTHNYQQYNYVLLGQSFFNVAEGFPRITPGCFPSGIHDVSYSLELKACDEFQIDQSELAALLGECDED